MNIIKNILLVLFLIAIISSCTKDSCSTKIKDGCICITLYDPVCGCDGVTYGNSCEAECSGITEYTMGACN